ncbi:ribosomal protein S5 domain 2-type protein [Polychytrium aggregatum]|uniref:ribosomal protein S5 domain 2-type protein n=1 Tax=Polychytrium aggregatum TaxID=110093 RepID=UPI0022FE33D0|nr:ribosomal protein S5 domain 2-type protein [Polychytrium aggregatum]KAI9206875.1 ribosomal protein S5 domain 2-type protein [Polychytrium aggregatum]
MALALDKKRIPGPAKSFVPLLEPGSLTQQPFTPEKRQDGRSAHQIRPFFSKIGAIKQANGSAYIEFGNLKVTCSVYGPRQGKTKTADRGQLNCDFKFAPFSCSRRRGYPKDPVEKEFGILIKQALSPAVRFETFPKSTVDIFVYVIESDGTASCLAAAITCASLALADAGIEIKDLVVASSAGFFGEQIVLDCSTKEESLQTGSLTLSFMPSLNEVTHVLQSGEVAPEAAFQGMELCVDACSKIRPVLDQTLAGQYEHRTSI